jgi:hypothetical protein
MYFGGMNYLKKPVKIEKKIEPAKNKDKEFKDVIKIENIKSERESLNTPSAGKANKKVLADMNQKIEVFDNKLKQHSDNISEQLERYNNIKKQLNEKPNINNKDNIIRSQNNNNVVESGSDGKNKTPNKDFKQTNDFLKDNLKATDFFKKIIGSNYNKIFEPKSQESIYNFLQTINKRIKEDEFEDIGMSTKKVTLSDFMVNKEETIDEDKMNKLLDTVMHNFNDMLKKDEHHDNIPLFKDNNCEVKSSDFKLMDMCYGNDEGWSNIKSTENNSEQNCDYLDSNSENGNSEVSDIDEMANSDDEKVLVIDSSKGHSAVNDEKYVELLELKEKFNNKINTYKEEAKKLCGEKDYNKIFDYYVELDQVFLY